MFKRLLRSVLLLSVTVVIGSCTSPTAPDLSTVAVTYQVLLWPGEGGNLCDPSGATVCTVQAGTAYLVNALAIPQNFAPTKLSMKLAMPGLASSGVNSCADFTNEVTVTQGLSCNIQQVVLNPGTTTFTVTLKSGSVTYDRSLTFQAH